MEYKHTQFDDSVNVTPTNPLKEFAVYGITVAILIGLIYTASFAVVELAVPYISKETEQRIWSVFFKDDYFTKGQSKQAAKTQTYMQQLLDRIPKQGLPDYDYKVIVIDEPTVNALALPSGKILVYTGLLNRLSSENAITFILGHELGHFAKRDHLRRLGSGLLVGLVMLPFSSSGSNIDLLNFTGRNLDHYFFRGQENDADIYGLKAVTAVYGHAGGATELFDSMKDDATQWLQLLSTHPISQDRIEHVQSLIAKEQIPLQATTPKH